MIDVCIFGDCRDSMRKMIADGVRVQMCVTSPPYWGLRDYGVAGQLGLESTPDEYVANMVEVFRLVRDLLADDGTLWLNLGDSYSGLKGFRPEHAATSGLTGGKNHIGLGRGAPVPDGLKPKDLVGIPWAVAFALRADGWYLRSDIIWSKPNPMPESVTDRPTKAHEYLFLLSKRERYFYDADAIKESASELTHMRRADLKNTSGAIARSSRDVCPVGNGNDGLGAYADGATRNRRTVWTVATEPFSGARLLHGDGGGSGRTVSPDCPVHGVQGFLASKALRDAQPAASGPDRSQHSDVRPDLVQQAARAPIATHHAVDSSLDSSGFLVQPCAETATAHSTRNHKTDRALATSPHETRAVVSDLHIVCNEPSPALDANDDHIHESNTALDCGSDVRLSGRAEQTAGHSACMCTYANSIDHFAVFPRALIEPCILAGTSQKGHCPACGKGWVRVTDRAQSPIVEPSALDRFGTGDAGVHRKVGGQYQKWLDANPKQTTGWKPSCACALDPVPGIVFDPFGGSGTTAEVAQRLGRRWLLCELNPAYGALIEKRTQQLGLELCPGDAPQDVAIESVKRDLPSHHSADLCRYGEQDSLFESDHAPIPIQP